MDHVQNNIHPLQRGTDERYQDSEWQVQLGTTAGKTSGDEPTHAG